MKKIQFLSKAGLITLWVLCLLYEPAQAQTQDPFTGIWEGSFMKDFRTAILFDRQDDGAYAGKILMYSGDNQIQNDEITRISLENGQASFYIAAKETAFRGTFDESRSELSGKFIFPDKSEHPLVVRKVEKKDPGDAPGSAESSKLPALKKALGKKIPVDELKSDLQYLINKLREYHPRLYSYTSTDTFDGKVSATFASLETDRSLEEFYRDVAPLVASVKCSHTGIRLPADYQDLISEQGNFLPLDLFIQGNRIFSLSWYGPEEAGLVPGVEINSINGRPASEIVEELLSMVPAEGDCQTTKYHEINRDIHSYFYFLDRSGSFEIQFTASAVPHKLVLEACRYSRLKRDAISKLSSPVYFSLETDPKVGVLKVESFGIRDMDGYFALLDSVFRELEEKEIPLLVLDLRDNSGGHPIFAAQLFSYLTDHEFTYFKRNPEVKDFEPLYHPMQANPLAFKGKVFALVNGACLSTTGHLVSLLKFHTDAVFVGEQPGSTFSCNDFSTKIALPHTGIEMNIPRTTFVTDVSGFQEGVAFPLDYPVQETAKDRMDGTDPYMTRVHGIIKDTLSHP